MDVTRRVFIARSAASLSLGFAGLRAFSGAVALARPDQSAGFGPLRPDPEGILDLPEGFSYRVISRTGDAMSDGLLVPGLPDGMAAFPGPDGATLLVCNHELEPKWTKLSPFGRQNERLSDAHRALAYDTGGERPSIGGTTTLLYDQRTGELKRQWLSLAGTNRNCAGGPTPWGSWITCEENTTKAGDEGARDHGYAFEVPARDDGTLHKAEPIRAMGRFYREAVAVHPASGVVYMTEDLSDACLYRYIPDVPGELHRGGRVQALRIKDASGPVDTRNWSVSGVIPAGTTMRAEWVDLDDVEAPNDDLRLRAQKQHGCAIFARTEGIWAEEGAVYIACTSGGRKRTGQIWKYHPSPYEGTDREAEHFPTLELFIEPNDGTLIENADNLTLAPWGDLIVCEDAPGDMDLVGVTPEGRIYHFAHNALSKSEFAGVCFSPDASTLFVNLQIDGLTLAVNGPWDARRG